MSAQPIISLSFLHQNAMAVGVGALVGGGGDRRQGASRLNNNKTKTNINT